MSFKINTPYSFYDLISNLFCITPTLFATRTALKQALSVNKRLLSL